MSIISLFREWERCHFLLRNCPESENQAAREGGARIIALLRCLSENGKSVLFPFHLSARKTYIGVKDRMKDWMLNTPYIPA